MIDSTIESELTRHLSTLSVEDQQRVLEFAKSLPPVKPKGTSGKDLMKFAGIWSKEEADLIEKAIKEGCRQIDHDGWDIAW